MIKKHKLLAAELLKLAADEFGNHGCNDFDLPSGWSRKEKISFIKEYHKWNGDPEEFDPNNLFIADCAAMSFLAAKLKDETIKKKD